MNNSLLKNRYSYIQELAHRWMDLIGPGAATEASGLITIASGSGVIGVLINGTSVTVTWATSDAATATALYNAINSNTTVNKLVTATNPSAGKVWLQANIYGTSGNSITVVKTGAGSGLTYSYATQGTLLGGSGQTGLPIVPQATLRMNVSSGTVGAIVNGNTVSVTWASSDAATAIALAAAINANATTSLYVVAAFAGSDNDLSNAFITFQATPAYQNTSVSVLPTGTGVTIDRGTVSFKTSGKIVVPDNGGIKAVYQLMPGNLMVVFKDYFNGLKSMNWIHETKTADVPTVSQISVIDDASDSRSIGVIVLNSMLAGDTVTVFGQTFTCVASGATGLQFNIGSSGHDNLTAINLAAVINANPTGPGYPTATPWHTESYTSVGGAVILHSTIGAPAFDVIGSNGHAQAIPSNGAMAKGSGLILLQVDDNGIPQDVDSTTTLKAEFQFQDS